MRTITTTTGFATVLGDGTITHTGPLPDWISTIPVFKPPRNPAYGPSAEEAPDVHVVKLGGNYSFRQLKGLNPVNEQLSLSWDQLSLAQKDALLGFFRGRQGIHAFLYGLPGEPLVMWRCPKWGRGLPNPFWTVQAVFERIYDPIP